MRLTRYHLFLLGGLFLVVFGPLAFTQPGPSGRGGKGGFDPKAMAEGMFVMLSGGNETFNVKTVEIPAMMARREAPEAVKERLMTFLQKKGVSDGTMTKANYVEFFEERMTEMRARREKEKQEGAPSPGAAPAPPAPPPSDPDAQGREAFKRLDTDGNGSLSVEEMQSARSMGSRIFDERERYDANRNGTIELDEYLAYARDRNARGSWGRRDQPAPSAPAPAPAPADPTKPAEEEKRPTVYRAGRLPKELPAWFEQADTDRDGQVGLYEWKVIGRSIPEFLALDHNGDGFITVEEALRTQRAGVKAADAQVASSTGGARSGDAGRPTASSGDDQQRGGRSRSGNRGPGGSGGRGGRGSRPRSN